MDLCRLFSLIFPKKRIEVDVRDVFGVKPWSLFKGEEISSKQTDVRGYHDNRFCH